jgi:N6-adenosine-specific RNA methylase IME4
MSAPLSGDSFPVKNDYQIVYADPPWSYDDKASAGKRGSSYKYPTMTIAQLESMPVASIVTPDATLFLWVTMPLVQEGLQVMKAWGFEYKTCAFTWVKRTTKSGKLFWGMGNWTRSNPEMCLLGVRGKPKRVSAGVHSVVESVIEEHSKKPDEVRSRIVGLMGDVPRIELFARARVEGWDAWGNELNGRMYK